MTATSIPAMRMATMKRGAEVNPNRRVIDEIAPGLRLAVVYEPPRDSWGRIDRRAMRDAVAPSLWWTWTVTSRDGTRVLNDEADVLKVLSGETPEREDAAQIFEQIARNHQPYLFALDGTWRAK